MWEQFRRLLLGTVIEYLLEEGVQVEFSSIRIEFHDESAFKVPRLDNYMRFKGALSAELRAPVGDDTLRRLERVMRSAWPSLLKVVDIPIGDRLTLDKNHLRAMVHGDAPGVLEVAFDFEAD